ncbi:MAG TPA: hypothetical protein VM260_13500, partial [Pirellula sp.]|nr:hypothetical protein [Pirellula sp.]
MRSLQVEAGLLKLSCQYPEPEAFREAVASSTRNSHESVVRFLLTEGIPFAFRDRPALFEALRAWLGEYLTVCPKEITLIGSARIGFSLASPPDYGRAFNENSDLDLSVVSLSLFEKFYDSFAQWKADYTAGIVQPRNERERQHWDDNIHLVPKHLSKGFVDANKVPNLIRYPIAQSVSQAMWLLGRKLEITEGAPKVRKSSIRIYNS